MFIILKRSWSRVLLILMGAGIRRAGGRVFLILTRAGGMVFLILTGAGGEGVSHPGRERGAGCF